jgi:hypothetical protein
MMMIPHFITANQFFVSKSWCCSCLNSDLGVIQAGLSLIWGYASIRRLRTTGLGYFFMLGNIGRIFEVRSFLRNISQNNVLNIFV